MVMWGGAGTGSLCPASKPSAGVVGDNFNTDCVTCHQLSGRSVWGGPRSLGGPTCPTLGGGISGPESVSQASQARSESLQNGGVSTTVTGMGWLEIWRLSRAMKSCGWGVLRTALHPENPALACVGTHKPFPSL